MAMATMTWDGPFMDVDPLSLQIMVQMQLEDCEGLAARSKGKQREGKLSDGQLAMQMYVEDLRNTDSYLKDRTMAQSAAMAILQDGDFIAEVYRREREAARDHEMAMRLDARAQGNAGAGPAPRNHNKRPSKKQKKNHKDPWEDPEMLEKVAAIYMQAPDAPNPDTPPVNYDSDGTVAESSTWAASRQTNSKRPLRPCIACAEEKDFFELIRVPCNHEYCRDCLETLFSMSIKDESLFPPRCENQEITLDWVRLFISSKVAKEFEAKYDELSTKNRSYCHEPTCATFIPEESITGDIGTCPKCTKTTCTICKNPSHSGNCPEDEALHQLLNTANAEQWQRCYQCTAMVELEQGCNHMRCRCGADFCYICGLRWKTCGCEQWDEPRLYQRAAQLVDRNPNRRLFEPARIEHQQPATRPPTPDSPPLDATTAHRPVVFGRRRPLHSRRQSTTSAGDLTSVMNPTSRIIQNGRTTRGLMNPQDNCLSTRKPSKSTSHPSRSLPYSLLLHLKYRSMLPFTNHSSTRRATTVSRKQSSTSAPTMPARTTNGATEKAVTNAKSAGMCSASTFSNAATAVCKRVIAAGEIACD